MSMKSIIISQILETINKDKYFNYPRYRNALFFIVGVEINRSFEKKNNQIKITESELEALSDELLVNAYHWCVVGKFKQM